MKYILLSMLVLFSGALLADGLKSEKEVRKYIDSLMQDIQEEKFQKAFDSAKQYWPLPATEIDDVLNQVNQQWPLVHSRFGNSVGVEFIKKEQLGSSFVRYYYLHKFDNHAIFWQIDLYKPHTEWQINGLVFSDDLEILYE